MKTSTKIWTGFIAGAALGTAAGILLAPDKGTNTRKKIAEKSKELSHNMAESYNSIREKLGRKVKNGNPELYEEMS